MEIKETFIHHVFFWMQDPSNKEEQQILLKGLQELTKVSVIQQYHIGIPAETNRDVIDSSYSFSWLAIFNNLEEEEIYQTHPIHLEFVRTCQHLWKKVVVYDSVKNHQ